MAAAALFVLKSFGSGLLFLTVYVGYFFDMRTCLIQE